MIRMTVRYPYKLAMFDGIHLFIWYLIREPQLPKYAFPLIHGSVTSTGLQSWQMSVALPMVSKPISIVFPLPAAPNTFEVQCSDLSATPLDKHLDLDVLMWNSNAVKYGRRCLV